MLFVLLQIYFLFVFFTMLLALVSFFLSVRIFFSLSLCELFAGAKDDIFFFQNQPSPIFFLSYLFSVGQIPYFENLPFHFPVYFLSFFVLTVFIVLV